MSKKKLSKEQRLEKRRENKERRRRNEEIRKKWSTEEHKKELVKTQGYLREVASRTADLIKPDAKLKPTKTSRYRKHEKIKKKKVENKKIPGIIIPKQYLVQKNEKKESAENKKNQEGPKRSVVVESAAANAFMVSVPRGTPNGRRKITNQKIGKNDKYIGLIGDKDYYDFAGEYEARNVEYGHGRKRNREWNDTAALNLKKELDEIRKMREEGFID